MKCSALNVDFNGVRFKEYSIRVHQIWVPPWKVRFLLLSTNLAREWLQIDTDLLRIITSTADELSACTNIDALERHWTPKIGVLVIFLRYYRLRRTLSEWIFAEIAGDRPRQPAYEIILMLSRISWALAQISCFYWDSNMIYIANCRIITKYANTTDQNSISRDLLTKYENPPLKRC